MKFFSALPIEFKIAIIVIIVIILWVLWRKFSYKLKQLGQARDVTFLPGETHSLTPSKEDDLKLIAKSINDDIEHTSFWTGHNYDVYVQANHLTDNELLYMAKYYKKYVSTDNSSLWMDIDSQVYTFGDEADTLQVRLQGLGLK